jgi:hypothetical protein
MKPPVKTVLHEIHDAFDNKMDMIHYGEDKCITLGLKYNWPIFPKFWALRAKFTNMHWLFHPNNEDRIRI